MLTGAHQTYNDLSGAGTSGPVFSSELNGLDVDLYNFVPPLYIQNLSPRPPSHIPRAPNLRQKIPRRVPNVIVRKRRHCEITMIVPVLPPHIHLALPPGRFDKVLGQELALFVEIVARALFASTTGTIS